MGDNSIRSLPFDLIESRLERDDDRELWQTIVTVLCDEFLQRVEQGPANRLWVLIVGACSHWVRPHNSRWNAAGGFMYPEGYKDSSPELDWSVILVFEDGQWRVVKKLPGKNNVVLRVAVPARTARHKQAAVHARWSPGEETVLYGFRNASGKWKCVAASDEKSRGSVSVVDWTRQ